MKTIAALFGIALATMLYSGCSTSASFGEGGDRHGVSASATTRGPGAGVGVRAY